MAMLIGVALAQAIAVSNPTSASNDHPGDTYLITRTADTSSHGSNDSSGSTHDVDQLVERVLTVTESGIEVEWDLPQSATKDERRRQWQLPARVLVSAKKSPELRNNADLEHRLGNWLRAGKMTRAACGHWVFTWNAFKIECDPQSVLKTIAAFDVIPAVLRSGESYPYGHAGQSASLQQQPGSNGLIAEWPVDPADIRLKQAEADIVVAEIMRKPPPTLEAALKVRAAERVAGTVTIVFDGETPEMRRRTRVTKLEITQPDGKVEQRTETEVIERKRLSPHQR